MKTKIITAIVAVFVALAFLPGVIAQENTVSEETEQEIIKPEMVDLLDEIGAVEIINILIIIMSVVGTAIDGIWAMITPTWSFAVNGIWNIVQTASYWIGDFATLFSTEGLDWLLGLLDYRAISLTGIGASTIWAMGSAFILGTMSAFVGKFIMLGPVAWILWPIMAVISVFDGVICAGANLLFGVLGGGLANVLTGIDLTIVELIPPLKLFTGHPMVLALGVGGICSIVGAIAGAILGGILGGIGLPIGLGFFIGMILGAISGLIVGFGTGFIGAGWH